ncbi:hypothetical protein WA026_012679 [Henosepilachna vigintioctopunctata]|uniref:FYVE-type domain-containing protein n=1 Tax=Henosepilachna vigintioctopunctata TaxID=420089 RepID=A0AAW1U1I0_9CUCU
MNKNKQTDDKQNEAKYQGGQICDGKEAKVNSNNETNCELCEKTFLKSKYKLLCFKCDLWICQKCTNLDATAIRDLINEDKNWICRICEKNKNTRRSIIKPKYVTSADQISEEESGTEHAPSQKKFTLEDVNKIMQRNHDSLKSEMKGFKKDILELQHSVQFLSDSFEELQRENKSVKRLLEEERKDLNKANTRISYLEEKLEIIDQEKRERNIMIMNAPIQENENTQDVAHKIIKHVGVHLETNNFLAKRISVKNNSPILVQLNDVNTKLSILKKRKEAGDVTMKDCGFSEDNVVYFNHDLSKNKQELFAKTRKYKIDNNYKYVWIKNGNIYLRKTESSPALVIRREDDLKRLQN